MATPVRFELTHRGVKFHCLTTWLRGNVAVYGRIELPSRPWQGRILADERIDHIILKFTYLAPREGLEPPSRWLIITSSSANWAIGTYKGSNIVVKAITTLLNCTLLVPHLPYVDFPTLMGSGRPYAAQLTLSAFSLGSSITPNWHFTKVAKSLYKISHLLVYDFDCFHWRINTHNLFSSSTTPRSWQ